MMLTRQHMFAGDQAPGKARKRSLAALASMMPTIQRMALVHFSRLQESASRPRIVYLRREGPPSDRDRGPAHRIRTAPWSSNPKLHDMPSHGHPEIPILTKQRTLLASCPHPRVPYSTHIPERRDQLDCFQQTKPSAGQAFYRRPDPVAGQ